jgi:hypothetical protein
MQNDDDGHDTEISSSVGLTFAGVDQRVPLYFIA